MPTIYHHPLTSSIEVDTEFDSRKIPVKYTTSTQESVYTIVSDAIFIGDSNTQYITFTANKFVDILFKEEGCDSKGRTLTVEELYKIASTFNVDENKITFKIPVIFDENVYFNAQAIFNEPTDIIFQKNHENLEDYISNNNWTFTNTITFSGADKINVIGDITLEDYVKNKIIEKGRLQIVICKDGLPEEGEAGLMYLVPKKDETGETYYEEYIWVKEDGKFELIGSTKVKYGDFIQKNDDNTLPQYSKEEWKKFNGKPGVMFDGKFYLFKYLESEDGETIGLDDRYVKLHECNSLEGETGLCFNGQFFSFESLYNKEWTGPDFITDKEGITVDDNDDGILICTVGNEDELKIMTESSDYIIIDAQCVDQNARQWAEIDYLEREGRCGVIMSFTPSSAPASAWLIVKTMNITDTADAGGAVKDIAIFLRTSDTINPKSGTATGESFKYKKSPSDIYTNIPENELVIDITTDITNLYITHSSFILLDAHLVTQNGLSQITGFSNNEIVLSIDQTQTGCDWLALKVLNKASGNAFYRSIKINK